MSLKSNPVKFELAAATVDPLAEGFDPSPLIPYVEQLGIPYFYERQNIIEQAKFRNVSYSSEHPNDNRHTCAEQLPCRENGPLTKAEERELTSICAFCSRMKRGVLYGCARRNGFNVLALGQHLDDLAESFMMSVFHNGFLRTMKANYTVTEGDLRVIRPLISCRELECDTFADTAKLPVINMNCPACFDAPKERYRTKCLLASQEQLFPNLFSSLQKCMRPLMEQEVEHFLQVKSTELCMKQRRKPVRLRKRAERLDICSEKKVPVEIHSMAEYERLLSECSLLVVKFGASWCRPCKDLDPIFSELCKMNPLVTFATVDVECDEAIADLPGIDQLPTLKFFKSSAAADVLVSPNHAQLKEALSKMH